MKKNICIFINTLRSGGAEKQAILLAKALNEKYNVWLVIYYGNQVEKKFFNFIAENNIKTIFFSGLHISKIFEFYSFLKKNKIDIIFSYLLTTNLISGLIGKISGVRNRIGGIRNSKLDNKKEILQKFLQNYVNSLTIYNNYKGLELLSDSGFKKSKAIVIPNCFEIKTKIIKKDKKETVTILSVGRFHDSKDYKTAIKATVELAKKRTDFVHKIIGYGALENQILIWIKEFKVARHIDLVINPPDINSYYKNADIYLMTSKFEGLSNAVMEAMSYSLPLVVTDVGDNNRLVANGENGFLCKVGDSKTIALKLEYLIENYDKRMQFGLNSYFKLKENYSFEIFQENYFELIENL